jgi:zinc protease
MEVMIRAGSAYDPAGKEGLANFTADLITEGTESKSATEIAEAIEFVGGTLSAATGFDASYISCEILKKDFELGVSLLSDILLHPAFPAEEIERQRSQILTSITGNRDRKENIAEKNFQEVLFGDHPYSHPIIGLKKSVQEISRDDIVDFYRSFYRPNNSTIVIAGDVDRAEVVDAMNRSLGGWESALITPPVRSEVERPSGYRIRLVNKPDVTQSEIRIGYPGIIRKDPDYFPLLLMNYTLGAGDFSSRLMQTVRSEMGLTYGISSYLGARVLRGPFTISTFTRTETTGEAIRAIFGEVEKMRREGITETEFRNARARFIGGFPLSIETPSQVAGKIVEADLYGLGEEYLARYTTSIDRVTLEEVNAVASDFLRTEDLVIVVVANAEQVRDELKKFGEVEEVFYIDLGSEGTPSHDHH